MNWSGWTELKPFDNYCNIKSYVGHEGKTGSRKKNWHTTLEKEQGFLSMSEGCSAIDKSILDNYKYKTEDIPQGVYFIRIIGAKGLHPSNCFDYIGRSSTDPKKKAAIFQRGIFGRIFDHYRKIVGLPARQSINKYIEQGYPMLIKDEERILKFADQKFNDYEELRQFFKNCSNTIYEKDTTKRFLKVNNFFKDELKTIRSIKEFFNQGVFLSFNIYSGKEKIPNISKGEGLALQAYKNKFGEYPFLNEQNEVVAIKDFNKML